MDDSKPKIEITDAHRDYPAKALNSLPFSKLIGMKLIDLQLDTAVISIEMRDDLRQHVCG